MKKIFIWSLLISFLLSSCIITDNTNQSDFPFKETKIEKVKPIKNDEILSVINNAVSWFKAVQLPSGELLYMLNFETNIVSNDNNMVRQAGAFFQITEVYKRDFNNVFDLDELIRNYAGYFRSNSMSGKYSGKDFKCIYDNKNECSVGTSALALIGFINYSKRNSSFYTENEDLIKGYLNYLLAMRIPEKGFISKFSNTKPVEIVESPFYNGEGLFALSIYYGFNQDENVLKHILELWPYFKEIYSADHNPNFYLWGMLALKELKYVIPLEEYLSFVSKYTKVRLKVFERSKNKNNSVCAFNEGLSAAFFLLNGNVSKEDQFYFENELNFWLKKNKDFQIIQEEFFDFNVLNKRNTFGSFAISDNDPTIRIDYTQHCLNAYLIKYVDIEDNELEKI